MIIHLILHMISLHFLTSWASLVAQRVKRLPAMRETRLRSLGREDPLEKEMAPHSSILAWRIPWTEEPGGLQSTESQRVGHDWVTLTYTPTKVYSEGRRRRGQQWMRWLDSITNSMDMNLGKFRVSTFTIALVSRFSIVSRFVIAFLQGASTF